MNEDLVLCSMQRSKKICCGVQCVVKDDPATGGRVVAGTHWDFDSYGGTIKKQLGMPTQVPSHLLTLLSKTALGSQNNHVGSERRVGMLAAMIAHNHVPINACVSYTLLAQCLHVVATLGGRTHMECI